MTGRFTVIGCGTVVPEADTGCAAYLLEVDNRALLLDCGPGTVRTMARLGLDWAGVSDILITHFHTDHVGGLPALLFSMAYGLLPASRSAPLRVTGPPGTRAMFEHLRCALGDYVTSPGFPLRIDEIPAGVESDLGGGLRLSTLSTPHTAESLALRLDGDNGPSLVYSGDSGPAVELGAFARAADAFVCECSLPDDLVGTNHLSPAHVARFAATANPRLVLLTHIYPQFRAAADVVRLVRSAGYDGRVELAREGWTGPVPG